MKIKNFAGLASMRDDLETYEDVDLSRSDNVTRIGIALDCSGSMMSHLTETIEGFNKQLTEIRNHSEHEVLTWFCLFGTPETVEFPIEKGEVRELYDLTTKNYHPYGSTPLLDGIGKTIQKMDSANAEVAHLVVVFSDGGENSSGTWTWDSLGHLIKKLQEGGNWTFVFIGPKSQFKLMADLGFEKENMLPWGNVKALFAKTAEALGGFLRARNHGKLLTAGKRFFKDG